MKNYVEAQFPAGRYYIGDLCYVLHDEWNEVCDLIIEGNECKDGEFKLKDGRRYFIASTAYGDGEYLDNYGRRYPVDSGSIGIILESDLRASDCKGLKLGNVIEFSNAFVVSAESGKFCFDSVTIDTADQDDEVDDEYFQEDDDVDDSSYLSK